MTKPAVSPISPTQSRESLCDGELAPKNKRRQTLRALMLSLAGPLLFSPLGCEGAELRSGELKEGSTATCPQGEAPCGGVCVDITSNEFNCGACGTTCGTGQSCEGGACHCQAGLTNCDGTCVDTNSSGAHCGTCSNSCADGLKCSLGACAESCASGLAECGADCVNTDSSVFHCGSCTNTCGTGLSCAGGSCDCPLGQTSCGGSCVDTTTSGSHCGACFAQCEGGEACEGGQCGCPPGSSCGAGSGGSNSGSGGSDFGSGGTQSGTGGTTSVCTNVKPRAEDHGGWDGTCEQWKNEASACNEQWFIDSGYCDETCGRCTSNVGTGGMSGGTGGSSNTGGNGNLGDDNPYPPLNGGDQNYSTRYWDCCKPSCGWSGQGNIHSCHTNGSNLGLTSEQSVCSGGQAQTCHGMAPWAHSTQVSYGFAAANGRPCGACYQLQFTGQGQYNANDPGSQAIAGKTMVVKVTNRGAELGDGHFDLLIPGGGLGMFDGCTGGSQNGGALGLRESQLGARNGGFMTTCASSGNRLQCIRDNCNQAFANHPDLLAGCLWSADWFQGADNPKFLYKQIDCPAALGDFD